jgi:mRNA-degrading endonuclease RelE of RelBE toxin-antitoxin system
MKLAEYRKLQEALALDEDWQSLPVETRNKVLEEIQEDLAEDALNRVYRDKVQEKKTRKSRRGKVDYGSDGEQK